MKRFVISLAVIGVILLIPAVAQTSETVYTQKAEPEVKLLKQLVPICACESGQGTGKPQQFNIVTKEVLRGKINPKDIGACQINLRWNGDQAKKMGLDLFKEQDNIKFANWLYQQQGSKPWNWSRSCWQ